MVALFGSRRTQIKEDTNVVICTIEKANLIVNKLLIEDQIERLTAVVVDELHLVGESMRGYLLEIILAKIHFISKRKNIQIFAMSATLPNLPQICKWLDAELFTTDFRPVAIYEYVSMPYRKQFFSVREGKLLELSELDQKKLGFVQSFSQESTPTFQKASMLMPKEDRTGLWDLVFCCQGQSLVFCDTKKSCEKYAQMFFQFMETEERQLITPELQTKAAEILEVMLLEMELQTK